eukprot:TRINITY_DN3100_c0_g2_i1.p1 TRINITY_DN3100_c0_g2~~TRINITY_DN3100_c0_g2_i1.p1  ORF type:complete len:191 (-),score=87.86 TRINITY_DN3100_c0_g2_i1:197-769(-)
MEAFLSLTDAKRRKLERRQQRTGEGKGVIYLGRIPHGFYEGPMKKFFSQFGKVTRLRLSRNKKTGKSKHYAFIEFDCAAVAKIVADAMNGYLLMGHILKSKFMEPEDVHQALFKGAFSRLNVKPYRKMYIANHNRVRDVKKANKLTTKLLIKEKKKLELLKSLGIDYKYQTYASQVTAQPTRTVFAGDDE